eukprot:5444271-Pleurochrysis_carterae.AAC.6
MHAGAAHHQSQPRHRSKPWPRTANARVPVSSTKDCAAGAFGVCTRAHTHPVCSEDNFCHLHGRRLNSKNDRMVLQPEDNHTSFCQSGPGTIGDELQARLLQYLALLIGADILRQRLVAVKHASGEEQRAACTAQIAAGAALHCGATTSSARAPTACRRTNCSLASVAAITSSHSLQASRCARLVAESTVRGVAMARQ